MSRIYEWKSDMKNLLQTFIREKQMTNFKYKVQARKLEWFDAYYYYNGYSGIRLTKPMLDGFIYGEFEKSSTHYKKEILMRDFAEFLDRHGYPVHVPLVKSAPKKRNSHIPYIFTQKQLYKLFMAVDSYPLEETNNRNVLDPVLFRLLYGSGLRVSEALNLRLKDIDLEQKVLIIHHAKNSKDRLVPIAQSLAERIKLLLDKYHRFSTDTSFLFPSITAGPRVHDLRYPNLNKIQTISKKARVLPLSN